MTIKVLYIRQSDVSKIITLFINIHHISILNNLTNAITSIKAATYIINSTFIRSHITVSSNFSSFQSAYRPSFSTETALSHIFNNLSDICDKGNWALVMVGLDLSVAFNTINHLSRLKSTVGET